MGLINLGEPLRRIAEQQRSERRQAIAGLGWLPAPANLLRNEQRFALPKLFGALGI